MPRKSKARYREERDDWVTTIAGRLHTLAHGRGNRAQAERELRRLLAERERARLVMPEGPEAPVPSTGELVLMFLDDCDARVSRDEMAPLTRDGYKRRLRTFGPACGDIPVDQLKPKDITAWLDSMKDWKSTSRHDGVAAVKAAFAWAETEGHIDRNPIAKMRKPPRNERRELIMDASAVPTVLAAIKAPQFHDFMTFLYLTGCRPGEACRLEASHVNLDRAIVVIPPKKHKTGRKTKKPRVFDLVPQAVELCRRLIAENPEGPIFRNTRGRPWDRNSINCQIRMIRARTGLGNEVVAYAIRHIFATDLLESGASLAAAAEILGHRSPEMIARVYSHLADRRDHLKAAVAAARPGPDACAPVCPDPSPTDQAQLSGPVPCSPTPSSPRSTGDLRAEGGPCAAPEAA